MKNTLYFLIKLISYFSVLICQSFAFSTDTHGQFTETEESTRPSMEDLLNIPIEELLKVKIVRIATGTQQATTIAPATTTLINAYDIEMTGATDIDEVLESVPGLHVVRSSMSFYNPIYALAGISSTQNPEALVLLNGVPINTLYTGGRIAHAYGGMPLTAVSRIEVIRGPGSALYGADAFSGVINIITKTKQDINGTTAGIRLGSFERSDAWLNYGSSYQGWDVSTSINYTNTQGQHRTVLEDAQTQYDKLFNTHASLAPGSVSLPHRNWDIDFNLAKDNWTFHTLYQKRNNVNFGTGIAQALDPEARNASDRVYTDLSYKNPELAKDWATTARIGYIDVGYSSEQAFVIYPAGAFNGAYPEGMRAATGISERHAYIDITGTYKGFSKQLIHLGTGYHYSEIYKVTDKRNFGTNPLTGQLILPTKELTDISDTTAAFCHPGNRSNWNIFAQDIITINDNWEMTIGGRYDRYSDFGSTFNPRLALVWKTTPQFTTKLLFGKAFRAPSFQELYQANNPIALGNPNLKPEKIQTYEIAFNFRPDSKWHIGLNAFTYNLTDKILFIPDSQAENYLAQNAGSQKGHGVVVEGGWQLNEKFVLTGSYALQTANDQNNHKVANVPRQDIYLRTDWKFLPYWHLNTQLSWILERERTFNDPRVPIDDYVNVDLSLHYQKSKSPWDFSVSVQNVFNADIREPTPGPDENGMIKIPYDLPVIGGTNYLLQLSYHF